ncbi:MAG: hypothetical protein J6X66_07225 [Lachnospiraceae bacterium]|nr:hypothetical protein [Lachnospiraceae bacterium]
MNRKRIKRIIIGILLVYVVLLLLLFLTEGLAAKDEGTIHSLGDAAWYLLATLTTVGYGDMTPVTGVGKVIGAVIMISSAGVLTFLLGLLFSLFFGRLLPRFTLWRFRHRAWYIFSCINKRTVFFAEQLAAEEPEAVFVFCNSYESLSEEYFLVKGRFVLIDAQVLPVVQRQKKRAACRVFYMDDNGWDNYAKGIELLNKCGKGDIKVCCESEHAPEHVAENMVIFNRPDNTARSYWLDNPPLDDERIFLIAGDGRNAKRLLERALLINVLPDGNPFEYHVFGNWESFKNDHYAMEQALSIDTVSEERDSVIFEKSAWNASAELLMKADRIIFCNDDHGENLKAADELLRYFPVKAKVDVCATAEGDMRVRSFGEDKRVLSPGMVLKERLNSIAIMLNELYGSKTGGGRAFGELSEFHRQSNIAAADHLMVKLRLLLKDEKIDTVTSDACERAFKIYSSFDEAQIDACRRLEHKRWMRFHIMNNWEYSAQRDNALRHHTLIVPYEKLTLKEKELDDSAWEVLGEVSSLWQ